MGNKIWLFLGIPLIAFALIFAGSLINNENYDTSSTGITREGIVYYSTTGDFEGRQTEPYVGIMELIESKGFHNLLTDAGAEAIEQILGEGTDYGSFKYIALCNATAGCGDPADGDTILDNEIDSLGLIRGTGIYTSLGNGYYQIVNTFTADAGVVDLKTNMTGLFNQSSGGTMMAINTFTLVTLQGADQLLTNYTVNITG